MRVAEVDHISFLKIDYYQPNVRRSSAEGKESNSDYSYRAVLLVRRFRYRVRNLLVL